MQVHDFNALIALPVGEGHVYQQCWSPNDEWLCAATATGFAQYVHLVSWLWDVVRIIIKFKIKINK